MLSRPEDIALVEREAIRIVIRPRCPGVCHLAVHDTVLHLLEVNAFVAVVLGRDSNVTGEGLATSQCTLGVARASALVGKFAVHITVFREGCRAYLAVLGCIKVFCCARASARSIVTGSVFELRQNITTATTSLALVSSATRAVIAEVPCELLFEFES